MNALLPNALSLKIFIAFARTVCRAGMLIADR
jgi:hypothetical protein